MQQFKCQVPLFGIRSKRLNESNPSCEGQQEYAGWCLSCLPHAWSNRVSTLVNVSEKHTLIRNSAAAERDWSE